MFNKLNDQLIKLLWHTDLNSYSVINRFAIQLARLLHALMRDIISGALTLRAMSLVFTTLLSLVPLLALSFSVLKGFNVHYRIEPLLLNAFSALGDKAEPLITQIVGFVENTKVGVIGSIGLAFLIWTVVNLMIKTEEAFNHIWKVPRGNGLKQTFTKYFTVILIGPILLFLASALTTAENTGWVEEILQIQAFGFLLYVFSQALPFLLTWGAFSFINDFVPNTRVKLPAAILGGLVAAIAWEVVGWGFAKFVASSAQREAMYAGSAFAVIIVMLLWVYIGWMILLIGASVSFYVQNPQYLRFRKPPSRLVGRAQEQAALGVMLLIAQRHHTGGAPWRQSELARKLRLPREALEHIIQRLAKAKLLLEITSSEDAWVPARDIHNISVVNVLDAVRHSSVSGNFSHQPELEKLDALMNIVDARVRESLADRNFGELSEQTNTDGATQTDHIKHKEGNSPGSFHSSLPWRNKQLQ